ncbi:phytoene desaturase family protein [Rhodopseudomonas palustris]|uniref:NAD(P)/FAD-dependent oxidoreductase n=1 Tax=Rhodopseudomonas palustris TaxID=1076 RepID=A0A418UYT0_RHOPL|nr:FAD-dependent oxidoreductase [Rhodopseudomonas palustris]RJF68450.1 NAD(P)/FAD-dependent oxidoreductase [Rhodopseudomonas palustris]
MTRTDVVVIGAGLGGLTAGAILARDGRRVVVIERSNSVGGAASSYKVGDLFVEGSLHLTGDPHHPQDAKHTALSRAGALDGVQWTPAGALYEVRGGPIGAPFVLPDSFDGARAALTGRFPDATEAIDRLLGEMRRLASTAGEGGLDAVFALAPEFPDWSVSLADKLQSLFGDNEALKCAIAGDLAYVHDDAASMWWVPFAIVQGGLLLSGGRFVQGGSQRLSSAIARTIRKAGGEVLLRRIVSRIEIGEAGAPSRVTHTARDGSDPQTIEAITVIGNAAPATLASLMPQPQASRLTDSYADRPLGLSLFALSLGLSAPPRDFGVTSFVTQLLPDWMQTLASYAEGKTLMSGEPGDRMPPLALADYAAIDSGVPAPPYVLSVVGPDQLSNWADLSQDDYRAKRARWQQAIVEYLDRIYPGLAGAVIASSFNVALSVQQYLGAPDGSVYGFAPLPPDASGKPYRSPRTVLPGLYLASSYSGLGGHSGAIQSAALCAGMILSDEAK